MDGERERHHSSGSYGRSSSSDRGGHKSTGRNGRGYKPPRDQRGDRSRASGRGGKIDHVKTPILLTRDRRSDVTPQIMPGNISIIQRDTAPVRHPLSPPIRSVTSPGALLPTPTDSVKQRDDHKRSGRSRFEGVSSSPSSYIPLQPGPRSREGGSGAGRSEHFLSQGPEMNHPVKLVDRSLHWEEKGLDFMQDQSDFLVVGVIGKQGVGKSTVMSLLAGTRTGAGKPFLFRTQSKEVWESGALQTAGVEMVVTGERVILMDTQPVLSESILEQLTDNEGLVPSGLSPDAYLELQSLQLSMFLYSVCHVVLVVMDTMENSDLILRFLRTIEEMKNVHDRGDEISEKQHYPQLVFVLNHASPDDFQPLSLREMHSILAAEFQRSKVNIAGGYSLAKSGLVSCGRGFPEKRPNNRFGSEDVNLHLLPSHSSLTDAYGVFATSRPEKSEMNLNPILSLLKSFEGHPSFNLLAETLRNQIFAMPRPPIIKSSQQQITEKEWFEHARRVWLNLKKTDLVSEYDRILQDTQH